MKRREGDAPERDKPPAKQGWRSAQELNAEFVGGWKLISERLEMLRRQLVDDVRAELDCSMDEADYLVESHLIGQRSPRHGPSAMSASPGVERLLGLKSREVDVSRKPGNWVSVYELGKRYRGGVGPIARKMKELRQALTEDIAEALGCAEAEAATMVEDHLIGLRKSSGPPGYMASPDAVRIAEDSGKLRRRVTKKEVPRKER